MEDKNWLDLLTNQLQLEKVIETNAYTKKYGLVLNQEEAEILISERKNSLKEQKRVELGQSVLPKIIYEFCDSAYINQENYLETLIRIQEIFFLFKNEMLDELTDDELLHFMKEQFNTICYGDLDYLEGTCLDVFAQAIRAGYRGYKETEGYGEYKKFDEVQRWDRELYVETLRELFWR